MTNFEKILIDSLSHFAIDKDMNASFDAGTADALIELAVKHKCLGMVFCVNRESFAAVLTPEKFSALSDRVLFECKMQLIWENELVIICDRLNRENVSYAVFKGASVRDLYSRGEYRTSSDEDILVGEDDLDKAKGIFISSGYRLLSEKNGEIKLVKPGSGFLVELHTGIVRESCSAARDVNELLRDSLLSGNTGYTCSGMVRTFNGTELFLILLLHFYNHFFIGGIGLRPLLDISVVLGKYSGSIDFDKIEKIMKELSASGLYNNILLLCSRLFQTDVKYNPKDDVSDMLLSDIISAGAFGNTDSSRLHAGAFVKLLSFGGSAAEQTQDENTVTSVVSPFFKRIIRFLKLKNKLKIIRLAVERRKLIKKLGL